MWRSVKIRKNCKNFEIVVIFALMSRIIVKGLPKNITEPRLRKVFEDYGTITDLSLKYTQDGVFRRFAFVGFESEDSGKVAVKKLNNTFVQTSKVVVSVYSF